MVTSATSTSHPAPVASKTGENVDLGSVQREPPFHNRFVDVDPAFIDAVLDEMLRRAPPSPHLERACETVAEMDAPIE